MQGHIQYNSPLEHAMISFGLPGEDDVQKEFRVGIIDNGSPDMICWHEPEWKSFEELANVSFVVDNNKRVIIDKRVSNNEAIERRTQINIDREWPPDARGGTFIDSQL